MFKHHPLFSLENIYRAYRQCRKHKRGTVNAMRFEQNLEENLVSLHEELTTGTYRPGRSIAFMIEKPKRREIFAADFRDRVVHHVLVGYLGAPLGTPLHPRLVCLPHRQGHAQGRGAAAVLHPQSDGQRDPSRLVPAARHSRLLHRHRPQHPVPAAGGQETDPTVLWLIRTLVFHEPTENCLIQSKTPGVSAKCFSYQRNPDFRTTSQARPPSKTPGVSAFEATARSQNPVQGCAKLRAAHRQSDQPVLRQRLPGCPGPVRQAPPESPLLPALLRRFSCSCPKTGLSWKDGRHK